MKKLSVWEDFEIIEDETYQQGGDDIADQSDQHQKNEVVEDIFEQFPTLALQSIHAFRDLCHQPGFDSAFFGQQDIQGRLSFRRNALDELPNGLIALPGHVINEHFERAIALHRDLLG
ncbi:MAG: hypothetical protein PVF59_09925, partial [Desulfobacterales bacterium]